MASEFAPTNFDLNRYDDREHLRDMSLLTCDLSGDLSGIDDLDLFGRPRTPEQLAAIREGRIDDYVPTPIGGAGPEAIRVRIAS